MKMKIFDVPSLTISIDRHMRLAPDADFKAFLSLNLDAAIGPELVTKYLRPYARADRTFVGLRPAGHLTEVSAFCIMDVPIGRRITRVVIGTASDLPTAQVKLFQEAVAKFDGAFILCAGRHPQPSLKVEFMDPVWALELPRLGGPNVQERMVEAIRPTKPHGSLRGGDASRPTAFTLIVDTCPSEKSDGQDSFSPPRECCRQTFASHTIVCPSFSVGRCRIDAVV